jgi:hypothetical protein
MHAGTHERGTYADILAAVSEIHEIADTGPSSPQSVDHVVAAAKAAADEEFNRAERFDRKALNLATVVGAFFSLSQIVVASVIGSELVPDSKLDDLRTSALAAVGLAAVSVACAVMVFRARRERGFPLDKFSALLGAAKRDDPKVVSNIVTAYHAMAKSRRQSNASRTHWYLAATVFAGLAIAATAVELAIALYAIT